MDERFKRHWERWHERIARGIKAADILAECSDETLVKLLAYGHEGNDWERNVIATELTNRISRLHRNVGGHSDNVRGLVSENKRLLAEADVADDKIRDQTDSLEASTEKTSRYSTKRTREGGW